MTKNVLVTISGLHYDDSIMMVQEENSDEVNSIEVTTPATYYLKNGKHYIVYDEVVEGIPGTIRNRIKIDEGKLLDITKSGITNSHMVFETDKINVTPYQTPYGDLLLGTYTKGMDIQIDEERIELQVRYSLDINGDKAADCDIRILIEANE